MQGPERHWNQPGEPPLGPLPPHLSAAQSPTCRPLSLLNLEGCSQGALGLPESSSSSSPRPSAGHVPPTMCGGHLRLRRCQGRRVTLPSAPGLEAG